MSEPDIERIPTTCTLDCGSRCELVACVRAGRLLRLDTPPNRADTVERPRLIPCARGRAHRRLLTAPERLTQPLRRVGPRGEGQFAPISWGEALDEIADRLRDVRARYGPAAVMHANGAGSISGRGFCGAMASRRFFSFWGAATEASGNESNYNASMAAQWMFGEVIPGSDRATLLDSKLILMWGNNPAENRMGPNTEYFIAQARDRGAKVILIDPRYTDSGILADQWIPIRPGTDAALVAAVAYVLETEGLADREFMATHTTGYDAYRRYLLGLDDGAPKSPSWAEPITGAPAATIYQLARDYGALKPAALFAGWGPQRQLHGEQAARAFVTLACLGGNVGVSGGGLASVDTRRNIIPLGQLLGGPYAPARYITPGSWARFILQDRLDPPLKLGYIVASNVINRSPDTGANVQALQQLDFVVVHEPFLTPTARCADLVLPIVTDLERSDLVTSWGHDAHLFHMRQAIAPLGQARTDYWIFSRLAERLGFGPAYTEGRSEEEWVATLLQNEALDGAALRRDGLMRADGAPRVALADFHADPVARPLKTPSGRIEITSEQATQCGLPAIPSYLPAQPPGDDYPLQLVTPHSKWRSNSCLHANSWLRRLDRHAVWLNSADAVARGIADGDLVEVTSPRGATRLPAKVTARIMPGVACIYQGVWYDPADDGVDQAGCANVLTSHELSPSGGITTHTVWVQARRSA